MDEQMISITMGLKNPIEIESLKCAFSDSVMIKYPKFSSVIVRDEHGKKHWERVHNININDHFIIHQNLLSPTTTIETSINDFLTDFANSASILDDKPLWKLHVLVDMNCVVLSVHPALGDEFSLMSMLSDCFGRNPDSKLEQRMRSFVEKKNRMKKGVWEWLTFIYVIRFIGRVLWIKDNYSAIHLNNKTTTKLVSSQYLLEDLWFVKTATRAIAFTTIDDVLLGVISRGLSKYLNVESAKERMKEQQHSLTAILKVNLHKDPTVLQKFEDKTSTVLLPMHGHKRMHPLEHVTAMRAIMNKKKMSYEAKLITSCLSPKMASWFYHRALSHSSLLILNIKCPSEEIAIGDNPVTFIRGHISSKPRVAVTINMVRYAGKVNLQVMVAEEVVRKPDFLIKCFHEALLEMKSYSKWIRLLLGTGKPTHDSPNWFLNCYT